jgi:parallel beta-helix repeat protein
LTLEGLAVRNGSVLNQLGGGIYVAAAEAVPGVARAKAEGGGSLTLLRVEVRGNSAVHNMVNPEGQPIGGSGGGVAAEGALTVTESLVEGNSATANGGGIYVTGSHVSTIEASTISGNTAVGGGGINLRNNVTLVLRNGTVDGNTATDVGAGINSNGIVNLVNSTITGNNSGSDAPNGGAGLNSFANGTFRFWNSMVADNRLGAEVPLVRNCGCTGTVCTGGVQFLTIATSLEDGDSCGFNPAAGDLVNTDPGILPLRLYGGATETRALAPFSEAIDAGTAGSGPNGCPPTDQRGVVRPQDGLGVGPPLRCDIGAVEYDPINDVDLDVSFRDGFEPE